MIKDSENRNSRRGKTSFIHAFYKRLASHRISKLQFLSLQPRLLFFWKPCLIEVCRFSLLHLHEICRHISSDRSSIVQAPKLLQLFLSAFNFSLLRFLEILYWLVPCLPHWKLQLFCYSDSDRPPPFFTVSQITSWSKIIFENSRIQKQGRPHEAVHQSTLAHSVFTCRQAKCAGTVLDTVEVAISSAGCLWPIALKCCL